MRIYIIMVVAVSSFLSGKLSPTAAARENRFQVAVVNGEAAYHSQVFQSACSDDVNRSLVLQEFKKQGYKLPEPLVDSSLRDHTARDFNGKKATLTARLKAQGVTLREYRTFLAEEIKIQVMFYKYCVESRGEGSGSRTDCEWLRALRDRAAVKVLRPSPPAGEKAFKF